jgi:hypothetical protein
MNSLVVLFEIPNSKFLETSDFHIDIIGFFTIIDCYRSYWDYYLSCRRSSFCCLEGRNHLWQACIFKEMTFGWTFKIQKLHFFVVIDQSYGLLSLPSYHIKESIVKLTNRMHCWLLYYCDDYDDNVYDAFCARRDDVSSFSSCLLIHRRHHHHLFPFFLNHHNSD